MPVAKQKSSRDPPRPRALARRHRTLESAPEGAPDPTVVIVGVGGSAGALSHLRALFASLPSDCNLAFVVVVKEPSAL